VACSSGGDDVESGRPWWGCTGRLCGPDGDAWMLGMVCGGMRAAEYPPNNWCGGMLMVAGGMCGEEV